MSAGRGFLGKTRLLAGKDFRIEARAREILPAMVTFVLTVMLLLAFSLPPGSRLENQLRFPAGSVAVADVLAGFLWVAVLFAGLTGFARLFEVEREESTIDALLLVPLDRSALFLAKALVNLTFIGLVELLTLPIVALLFGLELGARWLPLMLVVLLVDLGFVSLGTMFAAISARARSRELLLPVLALPALVPIFIAGTELTSEIFAGASFREIADRGWFVVLIAFDLIFGIVGALAFDFVLD
ncbi:MAG: heme exporter protein CcmB [Actinomycetota bacterium]